MRNILKPIFFIWNFIVFLFSTFISIYEGSEILYKPLEWKYTAIFSKLINKKLTTTDDILTIDYIIYSAKYSPLFPLLMLISLYLIVFQIAFWVFKNNKNAIFIFFLSVSILSIIIMLLLVKSSTKGILFISIFFAISGTISLLISIVSRKKTLKFKT